MSFDAEKIRDEIVQWIRDWFEENGKGCKAVVGLSGGKDSSVVAALCVEALGKENVFCVMRCWIAILEKGSARMKKPARRSTGCIKPISLSCSRCRHSRTNRSTIRTIRSDRWSAR